MPVAWIRSTYGAGSPQKNDTIGTRSSTQIASCSSTGKCKIKFTPNGFSVSSRTRLISCRNDGGGQSCACKIPSAPALLTAATNSGPVRSGPIGAAMIGCSMSSSWHNGVFTYAALLLGDADVFWLGEKAQRFFPTLAADAALLHPAEGDAQIAEQPTIYPDCA